MRKGVGGQYAALRRLPGYETGSFRIMRVRARPDKPCKLEDVPVILTSRSDNTETRMFSAALAVLFADATRDPRLLHPVVSE